MRSSSRHLLLAADVGGTKTTLALLSPDALFGPPVREAVYASAAYSSLEAIVEDFLSADRKKVARAVFAVAGPVLCEKARLTNLPWTVEASSMRSQLDLPEALLLNDVEGLAWAVPYLSGKDLHTLNDRSPADDGSIAVLAAGTGLGEASLIRDGDRFVACPSEGGHADFAPRNEVQIELLQFLLRDLDHVGCEQVASGQGLTNVYRFYRDGRGMTEENPVEERLAETDDPAPVLIEAAVRGESELCFRTVETFVEVLAAEAGNSALRVFATGGVFLGGGIPLRILSFLEAEPFMRSFARKGRFTSFLERIPVHVILQPRAVLLGAARRAAGEAFEGA
ncbi:glucokinase [Candidatus Bipolaricaulota bacterium]